MCITFIIRVNTDCCISHNGFRTCSCNGNKIIRSRNRILDVIQLLVYLLTDYLLIRNSSFTCRIPVHHTYTAIYPTFFIQVDKAINNSVRQIIFHRKTRTVPVATGTKLFQLIKNDSSVFFFPFPGIL
ncbi:hypothetical protein D3C86_1579130 [compost metagenome]